VTTTFAVQVRGLDPDLVEEAVEHLDEVFREVRLLSTTGMRAHPAAGLAERLRVLLERIYGAGDGRQSMIEALRAGDADIDLVLPLGAERDLVQLGLILDQLDDACRAGDLLSLPRRTAVAAVNWWSISEILRQRYGQPATSFHAAALR
jgi:hypothetical protein